MPLTVRAKIEFGAVCQVLGNIYVEPKIFRAIQNKWTFKVQSETDLTVIVCVNNKDVRKVVILDLRDSDNLEMQIGYVDDTRFEQPLEIARLIDWLIKEKRV